MIVVTGATGNVGRVLVEALARAGERVVAVSRSVPERLPDGVRHAAADLTDPESLRPAVEGASALFLHDAGAAHALRVPELLDVAKAGGVRRVVLLSSVGVLTRPDSPSHGGVMGEIERAVRESDLDWTVLRPSGFASNTFAWAESVRGMRTVHAPFGGVGLPMVDPADIAEVAALALRADGHRGRAYQLTGPALCSPREAAAVLAELLGENVEFVELTAEQARAQLVTMMPEPVAETTLAVLGAPTAEEQRITTDIERLLGRPARSYADWAERNLPAFR
ncbi:NAD(P)H-binding protein [Kitasatospora sp. NPDC006697]|uniref:NAD(P)H-binding protein n=1 Tax=Kitasatospora sp. NPDC006697 TaxID=3364020 RepID=UPI0036878D19